MSKFNCEMCKNNTVEKKNTICLDCQNKVLNRNTNNCVSCKKEKVKKCTEKDIEMSISNCPICLIEHLVDSKKSNSKKDNNIFKTKCPECLKRDFIEEGLLERLPNNQIILGPKIENSIMNVCYLLGKAEQEIDKIKKEARRATEEIDAKEILKDINNLFYSVLKIIKLVRFRYDKI